MQDFSRRGFLSSTAGLAAAIAAASAFPKFAAATDLKSDLPTAIVPGTKLAIADQNEQILSALRVSGELSKLEAAADLEWQNFNGMPFVLEALRAGAADVGVGGDIAVPLARAQNVDILNIGFVRNSRNLYGFYTAPGRGDITAVAQLKGKKIAYPKGTMMSAYVLKVLNAGGLTHKDVQLIDLTIPDVPDALRSGEIDAAALVGANKLKFETELGSQGVHALPEGLDKGSGLAPLYALRSSIENPGKAAALVQLVSGWTKAQLWKNAHLEEWAETAYVKQRNFDKATALRLAKDEGESVIPAMDDALVNELQLGINFMADVGELPATLKSADLIDFRFDAVQKKAVREFSR